MRILILTDCYLPSPKSGAQQIHDLGVEFLRQGHQVAILAPSDSISRPLATALEDGLRVARVRTAKIKGAGRPQRAFREMRLSPVLWKNAGRFLRENPCDLLVFYSPTIFLAGLVRRVKRLCACPAYLILRDIFPQWALDLNILRPGPALTFLRWHERRQYAVADAIGVQSRADLDYFRRRFPGRPYRLEVLYNWTSLPPAQPPPAGDRAALGLLDKVVFLYGGNIGVAQDMDNILRLAANVSHDSRIHFLLVGDGSEVPRINRAIAARSLHNIRVLPPLGQPEYLSLVAQADVGLVSLDSRLTTHNIPGKILGYFSCAKPVLASINPGNDLFHLFSDSNAGICLVNGAEGDSRLACAAIRLADDRSLRATMGRNGRRLLEQKFSVAAAAEQIVKSLPLPRASAKPATPLTAVASAFH